MNQFEKKSKWDRDLLGDGKHIFRYVGPPTESMARKKRAVIETEIKKRIRFLRKVYRNPPPKSRWFAFAQMHETLDEHVVRTQQFPGVDPPDFDYKTWLARKEEITTDLNFHAELMKYLESIYGETTDGTWEFEQQKALQDVLNWFGWLTLPGDVLKDVRPSDRRAVVEFARALMQYGDVCEEKYLHDYRQMHVKRLSKNADAYKEIERTAQESTRGNFKEATRRYCEVANLGEEESERLYRAFMKWKNDQPKRRSRGLPK